MDADKSKKQNYIGKTGKGFRRPETFAKMFAAYPAISQRFAVGRFDKKMNIHIINIRRPLAQTADSRHNREMCRRELHPTTCGHRRRRHP